MPAVNGKVEAISIKELPQEDNYGNTHRAGLKFGDTWYSYGSLKKAEINIKTGDSWTRLQKGMEVEFMYDQNGDFKNIKKKTFSITDSSGAVASAPQQQQAPAQSQGGSFVNPAEVGQCLNLAVDVMKLSAKDLLNPAKVKEAIHWYKSVRVLFTELYPNVTLEEVKEKPAPKKAVPPSYDDDEV